MSELVHRIEDATGLDWVQLLLGAGPFLGVIAILINAAR